MRIIDEFNNTIARYDLEHVNPHHLAFYGIIKGKHIYCVNSNKKELAEKLDIKNEIVVHTSPNFRCKPKDIIEYKMIQNTIDLIELTKQHYNEDEAKTFNIVLKDNDLIRFTYELIDNGYTPGVKYDGGGLYKIFIKFQFSEIIHDLSSYLL